MDLHPLRIGGQAGLSCWDGTALFVGDEALRRARLHPQGLLTSLWEELSLQPVTFRQKGIRHAADIAIRQLQSLDVTGEVDAVFFPSFWPKERLGVLLSVLQGAGIHAKRLIPRALALGAELPQTAWVLEQSWTRLSLSRIERNAGGCRFARVEFQTHCGVLDWLRELSSLVAEASLQQRRIDPLYSAESDQALFDRLYAWWMEPGALLQFETAGQAVEVDQMFAFRDRVVGPAMSWIHQVCGEEPVFTEPQLAAHLKLPACRWPEAELAPPEEQADGVVLQEELIAQSVSDVTESGMPTATHVVYEGVVYPLDRSSTVDLPGRGAVTLPVCAVGSRAQGCLFVRMAEDNARGQA